MMINNIYSYERFIKFWFFFFLFVAFFLVGGGNFSLNLNDKLVYYIKL